MAETAPPLGEWREERGEWGSGGVEGGGERAEVGQDRVKSSQGMEWGKIRPGADRGGGGTIHGEEKSR